MTPRQKVWLALSDLFLDTDVSLSFDYIERVLRASPYDIDEVERILRDEVAPVCLPNLMQVAGEWAGFPEDWLFDAIETYLEDPDWERRFGSLTRARALRDLVPEWPRLRARLEVPAD